MTYGKSLRKFYTSYSFKFQDIPRTLIPEKVVFYHSSQWKIVFSYVCLGRTLLFEFILSTQFSVHHIIQVLCKISFSLNHHEISLESQSCLVVLCQDPSPLSIPPLFPVLCYLLPTCWNYRRFHCTANALRLDMARDCYIYRSRSSNHLSSAIC